MAQSPTIYTYGHEQINVTDLIPMLSSYKINCVVDCRPMTNTATNNTPSKLLAETLKQHQIFYLPFHQHFGVFPQEVCNKRGKPIYEKATRHKSFLEGIERIKNGISKGYTIIIIDNQKNIQQSKRFNLIGKFLKPSYSIVHLSSSRYPMTQEEVEHYVEQKNIHQRNKKQQAANIGRIGESLAEHYLTQNNYHILDRNWNLYKGCELDIVALKDNKLYFIEVKTRSSDKYGEPQLSITKQKMKNITKAIHNYRLRYALFHLEYQIDSIAIIYKGNQDYTLRHFPDIRPNYYMLNYHLPYRNH